MSIFFASDIHFGHDNLRKYYPDTRGQFDSVESLDRYIIDCWNKLIAYDDTVYILGDLGGPIDVLNRSLGQLAGKKTLITGNHDKKIWRGAAHHFEDVYLSYHEEWINGQFVVMCHYPIWEWNAINRGSYHLHGHLHGRPHGVPGRILDVGIDNHKLLPWSFDEVQRFMETREIRAHTK
jgi:calcineurin-like phosphoesterase family protein